ncbi:MAG: hypothetical protein LBE16_01310 [Clostridiales Family XIII bacterium]|jgi:hypothetical protein|nr:hypothetical protein [Clostridiales Family XIII bacterium]
MAEKGLPEKERKGAGAPKAALTGRMRAHVLHYAEGLTDIERVHAIRIGDPGYNLLIMDDYAPVIGMVRGTVRILSDERELVMEGIKGFYRLLKNDFTLLIQPGDADERTAVGVAPRRG